MLQNQYDQTYKWSHLVAEASNPWNLKIKRWIDWKIIQINTKFWNQRISDSEGKISLDYLGYIIEDCQYTPNECIQYGLNYTCVLMVSLRLILWYFNYHSSTKEIQGIKEQDVFCEGKIIAEGGTNTG